MAIDFCKEHNDIELWTYLIDNSIEDPNKIKTLLDNIVGYVNPILLVNKIKLGQDISGLKPALIKMLSQYNLQVRLLILTQCSICIKFNLKKVSVQEGCTKILVTDYFNLHEKTVNLQRQGIYVTYDNTCRLCGREIICKGKTS